MILVATEHATLHQIDVQIAIVVVVEESHTAAHHLVVVVLS